MFCSFFIFAQTKFIIMKMLYIIKAESAIKIGVTSNLDSRIQQLQTGNPYKIIILRTYNEQKSNIEFLERKLHSVFDDFRLNGEWFKFHDNIEIDIHNSILKNYPNIEYKVYKNDISIVPKKEILKYVEPKKQSVKFEKTKISKYKKNNYQEFVSPLKNFNIQRFETIFYIPKSIKSKKRIKLSFFQRIMAKYKMTNYKKANLQNQKPDISDTKNKNKFWMFYSTFYYRNIKTSETTKAAPKNCP